MAEKKRAVRRGTVGVLRQLGEIGWPGSDAHLNQIMTGQWEKPEEKGSTETPVAWWRKRSPSYVRNDCKRLLRRWERHLNRTDQFECEICPDAYKSGQQLCPDGLRLYHTSHPVTPLAHFSRHLDGTDEYRCNHCHIAFPKGEKLCPVGAALDKLRLEYKAVMRI